MATAVLIRPWTSIFPSICAGKMVGLIKHGGTAGLKSQTETRIISHDMEVRVNQEVSKHQISSLNLFQTREAADGHKLGTTVTSVPKISKCAFCNKICF